MSAIGGITSSSGVTTATRRRRPAQAPLTTLDDRLPVPVRRAPVDVPTSRLPSAAFLAHLIATDRRLPQTRERRRREPAEGIAAYAAMPASARRLRAGTVLSCWT